MAAIVKRTLHALALLLSITASVFVLSTIISFLFYGRRLDPATCSRTAKQPLSSSSLLTIDPSRILSTLIERGGLVLPGSLADDLRVLRVVCSARESRIDVLHRELVVWNFTVSVPSAERASSVPVEEDGLEEDGCASEERTVLLRPHALRVGYLRMTWDSYLRPCVDVELSDVDILVEFTNLLLTKNNWNDLRKAGFPPALLVGDARPAKDEQDGSTVQTTAAVTPTPTTTNETPSSFVRIGSVTLSGNVTLRVSSRPLASEDIVPPLAFDLDSLNELNERMRLGAEAAASDHEGGGGRRGFTTNEVYDLVQEYFSEKVTRLLASAVWDVAALGEEAAVVQGTRRAFASAREVARQYADSVKEKGLGHMSDRLRQLGLDDEDIETVRKVSVSAVGGTLALLKAAVTKDRKDDQR